MGIQDDYKLRDAREQRLNDLYAVMNKYGNESKEANDYILTTLEKLSDEEGARFIRTAAMALVLRTLAEITEIDVEPDISDKVK